MDAAASRLRIAGSDIVVYPTGIKDVVTIVGALPAGNALAQGNIAVPALTALMLERGTLRHEKPTIAEQLDNVGATISFSIENQTIAIRAQLLRRDLPLVLSLLAEQLRFPSFEPREFHHARRQLIGTLRMHLDDTTLRAQRTFSQSAFPLGHPNHVPELSAVIAATQTVTLDELRHFHARHYGPDHLTLVLVGDVDPPQSQMLLSHAFAGWTGGTSTVQPKAPAASAAARSHRLVLPDKATVWMVLGQATGLRYRDPQALALRVGTYIFGSDRLNGRLMARVRDQEGLTYSIAADLTEDTFTDGSWSIAGGFAPQLLERGIRSTQRELNTWWTNGVTGTELTRCKQSLIGAYQVQLSTTIGIARTVLLALQRGYELIWLDEYARAIDALTLDQVNHAIKSVLDPNRMVMVQAGAKN